MDYGRFVRILKGMPAEMASERIWDRITHTLEGKRAGAIGLRSIWPKLLFSAAALAAVFVFFFFNYEKQIEARSFVQSVYSTEYIYETCKYDGLWN